MKQSKQELDAIIDNAASKIRDEQIDPSIVNQSATRVWARVSQQAAENSSAENINTMNSTEHIHGCDDFQSLIPSYLEGKLSTARTLLLEDHSNECIPCRQEMKAQKAFAATKSATFIPRQHVRRSAVTQSTNTKRWNTSKVTRWSVAAADGSVYVLSDAGTRQLVSGEQLQKGETVRTAKDSNAVLRLADGSTVEMRERSEFSVSENRRGVTIRLDRGDVIVEAAKQHNGRLYVQTPDSLVSVKGTIFVVESGIKGSRISVVEGEVEVNHAGKDETLNPGDQTTTSPSLDKTSVQQNVAWSRNAARYANQVTELAKLRRDINQKVARTGVRYSSKFADLVPENTVFYAALPNLSETLADSQRIMQDRIKQNPALAQWSKGENGNGFGLDEKAMARIQEFGSQLGDEIVVSAGMDAKGEPSSILVLGEIKDAATFRSYLDSELTRGVKGSDDRSDRGDSESESTNVQDDC